MHINVLPLFCLLSLTCHASYEDCLERGTDYHKMYSDLYQGLLSTYRLYAIDCALVVSQSNPDPGKEKDLNLRLPQIWRSLYMANFFNLSCRCKLEIAVDLEQSLEGSKIVEMEETFAKHRKRQSENYARHRLLEQAYARMSYLNEYQMYFHQETHTDIYVS